MKNLGKQKSKGEPTRSSTGGPQNRGRRIVPVSIALLNPGPGPQVKQRGWENLPQNLKERTSGKKRKKKINLPALSRRGVREPITIRKESGMR